MTWFTSSRERWFWISAAAVVVLIYSTLGFAQTLALELRGRDLVSTAFWLALWLVLGAVVVLGLKTRPSWAVVGVFLGIVGVYLFVMARMGTPEERTHLIEYGLVGVLVYEALKERGAGGRGVRRQALLAIAITVLLGTVDEVIQFVLPTRVFDIRDVGFNAGAALMAVVASVSLTWVRRKVPV